MLIITTTLVFLAGHTQCRSTTALRAKSSTQAGSRSPGVDGRSGVGSVGNNGSKSALGTPSNERKPSPFRQRSGAGSPFRDTGGGGMDDPPRGVQEEEANRTITMLAGTAELLRFSQLLLLLSEAISVSASVAGTGGYSRVSGVPVAVQERPRRTNGGDGKKGSPGGDGRKKSPPHEEGLSAKLGGAGGVGAGGGVAPPCSPSPMLRPARRNGYTSHE